MNEQEFEEFRREAISSTKVVGYSVLGMFFIIGTLIFILMGR